MLARRVQNFQGCLLIPMEADRNECDRYDALGPLSFVRVRALIVLFNRQAWREFGNCAVAYRHVL